MKRGWLFIPALLVLAYYLVPDTALAVGPHAEKLIIVADSRALHWSFTKFLINQYNTNLVWYGLWCTICTATLGVALGFITDQIMKLTGLDLTSRKIIEH